MLGNVYLSALPLEFLLNKFSVSSLHFARLLGWGPRDVTVLGFSFWLARRREIQVFQAFDLFQFSWYWSQCGRPVVH